MSKYYFLFVYGCTDPELFGPYESAEFRDAEAKSYWAVNGGEKHAIFRHVIDEDGNLYVGSFIGDELDQDNEEDYPHDITEYQGPFQDSTISQVSITEIDKELYDLYDDDNGTCLNEGCPLPFLPTREEVAEFVLTGKIMGKIE